MPDLESSQPPRDPPDLHYRAWGGRPHQAAHTCLLWHPGAAHALQRLTEHVQLGCCLHPWNWGQPRLSPGPAPMERRASGQQRSGGRGGYSRFWGSGDSFGPVKQEEACNWGMGSSKRRLDGAQITTLNQSRSHLQSPSLLEGLPGLFNLQNPAPQTPLPGAVSYLRWPCSAS